jgi:hypothetical protein
MEVNREAIRQTVTRQDYSPLAATIKAGYELECVLDHLQKDEFTPDDIREISSSFNDVIAATDKIKRILVVKNK